MPEAVKFGWWMKLAIKAGSQQQKENSSHVVMVLISTITMYSHRRLHTVAEGKIS
jgi:hypothetical protein